MINMGFRVCLDVHLETSYCILNNQYQINSVITRVAQDSVWM